MHLIFGGAYQGKLDYARERYQLDESDIFFCPKDKVFENDLKNAERSDCKPEIDFSRKVIYQLEEFILSCVRCGMETGDYLKANREGWENTVFICNDISAGIVPCDPELRLWREMAGRTLTYLGKEAEEVTRLFCGIPQRIK